MSQQGGYNYRPNVARNVTQKWKEAAQANYGGDDWGDQDDNDDDDEEYRDARQPAPVSAGNPRHPAWGGQPQMPPSNRSATNPSPSRSGGRASFDRGDERRYFSGAGGGFESPYPTTQRAPFPESQPQTFRPQPPQIYTQPQGPHQQPGFRPSSRGQQQGPYTDVPLSAPGGYAHRRSESGNRTGPPISYPQHNSPIRPDSRTSNASGRGFPPRKSSLSQDQPPADLPNFAVNDNAEQMESNDPAPAKALPFIRPSDIYKRMEEEREKERRSQESSRPSIDLNQSRTRDSSTSARSSTEEPKENVVSTSEDTDSTRKLKPTLDTVMERKSEYGFDNMLKGADPSHPSVVTGDGVHRHPTNASSVYTDRADPVSASSMSRNQSLSDDHPAGEPSSAHSRHGHYALPSDGRTPSWGTDLESITTARRQDSQQGYADHSSARAPPLPIKDNSAPAAQPGSLDHLGHKPSLGYTSVVHQAFDESQNQALSPISGEDSVLRSNSASASEMSPIVGKRREPNFGSSGPLVAQQPIPEEPVSGHSRSISESTARPEDKDLPAPPPLRQGYRRDSTPPSRDNSPAKRLSVEPGTIAQPAYGLFSSSTNKIADDAQGQRLAEDDSARSRSVHSPVPPQAMPPSASAMSGSMRSPDASRRTASEEYRDWQAQRKQFNNQMGFQDSNPTTPGVPSPISRTESPPKGKVKHLAGRLESDSGRSTPVSERGDEDERSFDARPPAQNQMAVSRPAPPGGWQHLASSSGRSTPMTDRGIDQIQASVPRPAAQSRLDSFRPTLPGGWQSYSGTPTSETPPHEVNQPPQPPSLREQGRLDSTESIPTAKRPQQHSNDGYGPATGAFAAAAAAGSALAGAFGADTAHESHDESQDSSENEWDQSSTSSKQPGHPDTRDFAESSPQDDTPRTAVDKASLPPLPLPKDTQETPTSRDSDNDTDLQQRHPSSDYFPAPLRTSRSADSPTASRQSVPNVAEAEASPMSADNDQLQQEIVNSLTPRAAVFETRPDAAAANKSLPMSPSHEDNDVRHFDASDDDMYGGDTPSRLPSAEQTAEPSTSHQAMPSISTVDTEASPQRPFLEQRFSWEEGNSPIITPPAQSKATSAPVRSVVTEAATAQRPMFAGPESTNDSIPLSTDKAKTVSAVRPTSFEDPVGTTHDPSSPISQRRDDISPIRTSTQPPNPVAKSPAMPSAPSSSVEKSFRNIMKIENQQERIQAFDDTRNVYGQSDNGLDNWISSMQTAEHSDLFQSNGRLRPNVASAGNTATRPAIRRPGGNASGSLVMKEDGKRLMAAAGTFGGKTGKAAKGLFAKGKDKLRAASASEKGTSANRRKSSTSFVEAQHHDSTPRDSKFLDPPQIPVQNLEHSPIDANEWVLPSEKDQSVPKETASRPAVFSNDSVARTLSPLQTPSDDISKPGNTGPSQRASIFGTPAPVQPVTSKTSPGGHIDRDEDRIAQTGALGDQQALDTGSRHEGGPDGLTGSSAETSQSLAPRARQTSDTNNHGLSVPAANRLSIASAVSSVSPSPATTHEEQDVHRSVSPVEQNRARPEDTPSHNAQPTKEDEAARERTAAEEEDDPVPAYDEAAAKRESRVPRVAPGVQIVPVADLHGQKRNDVSTPSRPFSFDGTETLNQALQQKMSSGPGGNTTEQPLSPASQALNKEMSVVSAEDITEDRTEATKRQSRSYSRPFSTDPVRDHPALRQPDPVLDRSQMYSSESPLPSARRPQQDLERLRTASPAIEESPEEDVDEGYRIPGPYHKEYRSPRRGSPQTTFPPVQRLHSSPDQDNAPAVPVQAPQQRETHQPISNYQQPSAPSVRPEASRGKQKSFKDIFYTTSKSRSRHDRSPDRDPFAATRHYNRQDSMQSNQSESRDVVGQLPPPGTKHRRFSRDVTGMNSSHENDRRDTKKKRSSMMGFFSRGSKNQKTGPPQRSSTLPSNTEQPYRQPQPESRNISYRAPGDRQSSYQPAEPYDGGHSVAGGRYDLSSQNIHNGSDPQNQPNWSSNTPAQTAADYAQPSEYSTYQQPSQRPTNLHVDTGDDYGRRVSLPATAPPRTQAPRDVSYQSPTYYSAATRASEQSDEPPRTDPRVADLHKRSRSPKLGRRSSEDEAIAGAADQQDESARLGTFSNKKISPAGGITRPEEDQEAPFRIALPGDAEEQKRRTKQLAIEQGRYGDGAATGGAVGSTSLPPQTVADKMTGPQLPGSDAPKGSVATRAPLQERPNGTLNPKAYVAELPGSKAQGYESEEEIPMSATAGPGQWNDPLYFGDWSED